MVGYDEMLVQRKANSALYCEEISGTEELLLELYRPCSRVRVLKNLRCYERSMAKSIPTGPVHRYWWQW